LKEALGRGRVPCGTQQGIDQIAIPIDRSIQIAPLAFYLQIGFIDIPTLADFALALPTELLRSQRGKAFFPLAHGFVREREPTQQKSLGPISQAQLVPQPAEHDLKHDIGGEF
jgi:hypothetical protein